MSYYSLPSIKCSERKNLMGNVFPTNSQKCINLNPDSIYSELYPGFSDPLSKYDNQDGVGVNQVGEYYNISKDSCANKTLLNNTSEESQYFSYDDNIQTCSLYNTDDPLTINTTTDGVTSELYKKSSSNGCSESDDCIGCQTFCDTSGIDNYEQVGSNIGVLSDKIGTYAVDSLTACKDMCNDNSDCKTVLYKNTQATCKLYKDKATGSGSGIIYKMKDDLGNKISMNYLPYYSNYQEQAGDYTCGYSGGECYEISQSEGSGCPTSVDDVSSEEEITRIYNYPVDPPSDDGSGSGSGKVGINGFTFDKCLTNSGGSCVGTVYTNDNMGFPKRDRTSNPPTQSYMIRKRFDKESGKKYVNCPKGWTPNMDGDKCIKTSDIFDICVPNDSENGKDNLKKCTYTNDNNLLRRRPRVNGFESVEGCKGWCDNNDQCIAVVSTVENGNTKCYYYNNKIFNNSSNFVSSANYNLYSKKTQEDDYIYNVKSYAQSLVDNKIPLTPSLNQILNPNDYSCDNNYFSFTKCLKDSDIDSDLVKLSGKCQNEFGEGYIADENAISGKKSCENQTGYSRYRCNLDPSQNTNVENINFEPKLNQYESFTNQESKGFGSILSTNNQTSFGFNIYIIISIVVIALLAGLGTILYVKSSK